MKFGSMNNPSINLFEEIARIGDQYFDFIDLTYEPPANIGVKAEDVSKAITKAKLDVVGHTSPALPTIYPLQEVREACIAELIRSIDFFTSIKCSKVNIHPFYYSDYLNNSHMIDANIEILKRLVSYAIQKNIKLMLENSDNPFDNPKLFGKISAEIPELYFHLDIGHCNLGNDATKLATQFFQEIGDKIIHVHAHDNDGVLDQHLPCGCGTINWTRIVSILKHFNYNNTITIEVFCNDYQYLLASKKKLEELLVP